MGGIEVLFWIAIIVFSMLRGIQQNKKRPPSKQSPSLPQPGSDSAPGTVRDPLQEALREIEAALRGEPLPSQQPQKKAQDPIPESKSSRPAHEPEFHSMESSIPARDLESKTTFQESYSERMLEKKTTYEDTFKKSTEYYDDVFKHAHPDMSTEKELKVAKPSKEHPLRKRLKDKNGLKEAIVLQTILTRRSFPPERF